jgi:hypothetical protein
MGHVLALPESRLQSLQAARVGVLPGRDAQEALERSLQVAGAHTCVRAQGGQGVRLFKIRFDLPAGAADQFHAGISRGSFARPAATAGTKLGALGGFWQGKENHLISPRPPRRARRAAIDACGAHGKDELPIPTGISRKHCLPVGIFPSRLIVARSLYAQSPHLLARE